MQTLKQTQLTVLQIVSDTAQQLLPNANGSVYWDGANGVGMSGTPQNIHTVFTAALQTLQATQVTNAEALSAATGQQDLTITFTINGYNMYLTTCYSI